jgi:putative ubiquitin-RnfH superfamily antitoxin RatB of RatAB toxin-antitoxin module
MNILIVLGWGPREVHQFEWPAPEGSTVQVCRDQLQNLFPSFIDAAAEDWQAAIWGKPASLDHILKEGDRVEWLRGLRVDPKVARRERFQRQGRRTAGLFANKRPGSQAGY